MADEEWAGPFRQCGLESLLTERHPQVSSVETGTSAVVAVPALGIGQEMMTHIPVREEFTAPVDYQSRVPWLCVLSQVSVHGPPGILRIGDVVVADTVPGQDQAAHYQPSGDGVRLRSSGVQR